MTDIVVADAGPLIGLARVDRISLIKSLYGTIVVPEAVLSELRVKSDRPGAKALSVALAAGVIQPRPLAQGWETELERLCRLLDTGEASAILLAEQTECRGGLTPGR